MYFFSVAGLMLVFPLLSIAIEASAGHAPLGIMLIGKWYVFWAVGLRLLLAGIRQILQPRYTAETILGIKGDDALLLVRELGFGNLAIGVVGTLSLFFAGWVVPAALVGGLFYGLAGINHALQRHRNAKENLAMVSDLFAAVVLLVFCGWSTLH
ncbi:hypothetical protein QTI17_17460 [Variovorax sp. J31P179]|uniref:DUF6790 family protein n=1 Tax=Variovorax sp. J31P179 TaxID=3053508 RepID=UPI002574A30B|nr:DUF6790 family protein [Variovorax sp. J31P179]MDM0082383.1 hypothetical protein [Variovorax sp. J31P179]